ncbi:DeoR/GlpR transcriptional regulator [Caloramator sp. E03]|uniref:DeoR/GlpR family DNA-binding transcription regulator n=1 Tax=Caloramator sp. E03 TaxID=2576307 RepID=UPI001110B5FD|nr:DeoR/GlpR family DNA-binding transcription regulator [Caloramator sp. E03]QCX33561.1 DeoR/GlpR transcriptional regulator [Caloramator sp. E03]
MKNSKGVVCKRQQLILQYLNEHKTAKVETLSELLNVSPITIRRDLQIFEEKGIVERFHGGATLIEGALGDDPSLSDSSKNYILQKLAIAKMAASLINDGDTIFMNSSSTALLVLKYLHNKHVIVITNNGKALQVQKDPKVELVLTGGEVYERKQSMVGEFATHILSKVVANKCIMGVSGINIKTGITTSVLQETAVNQMMLKRCSGPVIVLADSSKIGVEHNFISGDLNKVSYLITDSGADPKQLEMLKEKGIEIITVDPLDASELNGFNSIT